MFSEEQLEFLKVNYTAKKPKAPKTEKAGLKWDAEQNEKLLGCLKSKDFTDMQRTKGACKSQLGAILMALSSEKIDEIVDIIQA